MQLITYTPPRPRSISWLPNSVIASCANTPSASSSVLLSAEMISLSDMLNVGCAGYTLLEIFVEEGR